MAIKVIKASAGTGKTYNLVLHIEEAIKSGILPKKILAFTFTVNAKDELRQRLSKYPEVRIETMHSLFLSLLKNVNPIKYGNIIDENQKESLIFKILLENKILNKFKRLKIKPRDIIMFIGLSKNLYVKPLDVCRRNFFEKRQSQIYQSDKNKLELHYKKVIALSQLGIVDGELDHYTLAMLNSAYLMYNEVKKGIDFDDMLIETYELMLNNTDDILTNAQEAWDYIFVDEFQDTNILQLNIIKMMIQKHNNLFLIGDWKQSIYEWRGGDYRILKNIENWFKSPEVTSLKKTYRNSKKVLDVANFVSTQFLGDEEIETNSENVGFVQTLNFQSQEEEAEFISRELNNLYEDDKTAFCLTRTNSQLSLIEMFLLYHKIPYFISCKSVLKSDVTLDIALMLFLCEHPKAREINVMKRLVKFAARFATKADKETYIESRSLENISRQSYDIFEKIEDSIENLAMFYIEAKENGYLSFPELASKCISAYGYREYLEDSLTTAECEEALSIMDNFVHFIHLFQSIEEILLFMSGRENSNSNAKIKLLTVHASKGLEADNVFIAGMTNGVFPSSKTYCNDENMEAEKRLLYVAVTRAKECLLITSYNKRSEYFMSIENFLN